MMSAQPCSQDAADLDYETSGPTRILPHLSIGCMKDALSEHIRAEHNITHILNVTITCPKPEGFPDENFCRIPINDGYIDELLPHIDEACQFIDKVKQKNGRVLVHCMAGISRSAAVTIAYVMKTKMIPCEQAYRFVKALRPIVSPNFNFLGQLLEYEKGLSLTSSPSSGAGNKRKRFELDLRSTITSADKIETDSHSCSPVHTKRLYVDNNNTLSSMSPASALANLRFEHSLETYSSLPPPSSADESHGFLGSPSSMNPPKRCHSWNGLADLAKSTSDNLRGTKHQVGLVASRPRSLNLSMSNIAVPPAVLHLSAQVEKNLANESKRIFPGEITKISEEFESGEAECSKEKDSLSSSETPRRKSSLKFDEVLIKVGEPVGFIASELSASQPTLKSPSLNELGHSENFMAVTGKSIMQSSTNTISYKLKCITSANTAPSDLNKSLTGASCVDGRRRSRSMENLMSPHCDSSSSADLCMKCGRIDKRSVCHGLKAALDIDSIGKSDSLHSSTEMIQVS